MTLVEMPRPGSFESMLEGDLIGLSMEELWLIPLRMAEAAYAWQLEMGRLYAGLFSPLWHAHPHAARYQLEVPDPIAEAPEQDLFA